MRPIQAQIRLLRLLDLGMVTDLVAAADRLSTATIPPRSRRILLRSGHTIQSGRELRPRTLLNRSHTLRTTLIRARKAIITVDMAVTGIVTRK